MTDINSHTIISAVNGTDDREARPKSWIALYTRPRSLGQSAYSISFEPSSFHVNDKVRIVRGPLLGLVGDIIILGDDYVELAVSVGLKDTARLKIEKINIEILK